VFDTVSVPDNFAAGTGGGLGYTGAGGLTIIGSTFSGGLAARGAGIDAVVTAGAFVLTSSTLSGNTATGPTGTGAGLYLDLAAGATASVVANTVAFNRADGTAGAAFDVVSAAGANTLVRSTLIADNTTAAAQYRFTGAPAGLTEDANWVGANAGLLPLSTAAGGLTPTHPLRADSPVLDRGADPALLPATDQRGAGFVRAVGRPDVGAVERPAAGPRALVVSTGTTTTSRTAT
jgi:hypothetical protein